MAKYRVLWHLNRNGKLYEPGQTIELSAEVGAGLHCLQPISEASAPQQGGESKEGKVSGKK